MDTSYAENAHVPTVKEMAERADVENTQDGAKLTVKQELFCQYYTKRGQLLGNATLSYAKAYGYDLEKADTTRATKTVKNEKNEKNEEIQEEIIGTSEYDKMYAYCNVAGPRLLVNDSINARIQALMLENFNDDAVYDSRLDEIALHGKPTDAIQAIKHRNDLKQRITKKLDITSANRPLAGLSDEELRKMAGDQ